MRILFFGTPKEAKDILQTLAQDKRDVVGVVTQPDRPKGRGLKVKPSSVKELALKLGLPVLEPEKLSDETFTQTILKLKPDIGVVVAYGKILPKELLKIPKFGFINLHASLLPKYRGAAPIQWAILNGEEETGVTIFRLVEQLDAGEIISQAQVKIAEEDNTESLSKKIFNAAEGLLLRSLDDIEAGAAKFTLQDESKVSFAPKISKELPAINWKESAKKIFNKVRALSPHPGAYTIYKRKKLKIWKTTYEVPAMPLSKARAGEVVALLKGIGFVVLTCDGPLLIKEVQVEGGKKMNGFDFSLGHKLSLGDVLPS